MSVQIKTLVCPQCGSGRCNKLPGSPNLYACASCGAEFVLSDSNAPKEVRVVHSMDPGQFDSLKRFKYIGALVIGLLVLAMVMPQLLRLFETAKPMPVKTGRLVASTLYQTGAKQYNVVRVMESGDDRNDAYQILVNQLDSGKKLAEPQRLEYQRNTMSQQPKLAHFSDGNVYLVMNAQRFMRLDAGSAQFVDLNDQLINRYPKQLSMGIAKIELPNAEYKDALVITSNSGERFYVYWLTGEINAYGDNYQNFRNQPFDSYTQSVKRYAFTDNMLLSADTSFPTLLVSYQQKIKPDSYQNSPTITLMASDTPLTTLPGTQFKAVTPQWQVDLQELHKIGVDQLQAVAPVENRFRGEILAQNTSRVLIVFNTTPVTDQGRVLQLLDVADGHVVWSRTVEQLPQITRRGTYLAADALASGFYIRSDSSTPSLLIDNEGVIVHDFSGPKN